MKKNFAMILPLILLFTVLAKADVPPDPGFQRVSINLVTETAEDLADYRFFLDFYGDLREVEINSKGRTEIEPMGGGARYRSGTLLAVPKKNLKDLPESPSTEQLKTLSESIKAGKIAGVAELARHGFTRDIPKGEKPAAIRYELKLVDGTLKAAQITEEKPKSSAVPQSNPATSPTGLVVGGILLTLAVVLGGVFAFRKASKKV